MQEIALLALNADSRGEELSWLLYTGMSSSSRGSYGVRGRPASLEHGRHHDVWLGAETHARNLPWMRRGVRLITSAIIETGTCYPLFNTLCRRIGLDA
jgi:hypothetical protein